MNTGWCGYLDLKSSRKLSLLGLVHDWGLVVVNVAIVSK